MNNNPLNQFFGAPAPVPGMTMDFPGSDWRSNKYAVPQQNFAGTAVAASQPCRQHDAFVHNQELCTETKASARLMGSVGTAAAATKTAFPACMRAPFPHGQALCLSAAAGAGATAGWKAGNVAAQNSSSCQYIVNGAGDCVDASHNHR